MVGKPLNSKEMLKFATDSQEKKLYVVAGSGVVNSEEKNKLQGWIIVWRGKSDGQWPEIGLVGNCSE